MLALTHSTHPTHTTHFYPPSAQKWSCVLWVKWVILGRVGKMGIRSCVGPRCRCRALCTAVQYFVPCSYPLYPTYPHDPPNTQKKESGQTTLPSSFTTASRSIYYLNSSTSEVSDSLIYAAASAIFFAAYFTKTFVGLRYSASNSEA